jgi:peroxiredoxin (alkyl hydroperoxide reductase subunit C)
VSGPTDAATTPAASITHAPTAPSFTLTDHHGAEQSLSALLAHGPALLVFYPFAFSSICGNELNELQEALPTFTHHDVQLLAISCDPMYALRTYADREKFDFLLLSDFWPHGQTARAYGVFDETRGCATRGSFLVAQDGTIQWSLITAISQPRPISAYHDAIGHHTTA